VTHGDGFELAGNMLVLIDESGDCGLKFGRGSSDYFVVVALLFSGEFSMGACPIIF